jgi:hypothetical protein
MVLYAAKLKASAKPVSDLTSVEKKTAGKSKRMEQAVEDVPPPPMDKKEQAKLKRKEKALLKKQKEEEELNRQQEEAQVALAQKEAELKAAEDTLKLKKEAQKEKRRLKREAKKVKVDESVTESIPSTNSTEATLVPENPPVKKTRKRKQVTIEEQVDQAVAELPTEKADADPPAWFKKYVAGVKNEESQHRSPKKAKRTIAKEANQVATEQWGNGLVRDRVRNEVDQHMSRM